jgi:ferrochelatase
LKSEKSRQTGILLLNLGGPDSLDAVRPFLYNLFSDRLIIRLGPSFMQRPLARLISSVRAKKTQDAYKLIGGKSPIGDITMRQARALEEALNSTKLFKVYIGMRYWHPFIEKTVEKMYREGITRILALSLYPHYSVATTGSSLSKLKEAVSNYPLEIFTVESWYNHPGYIDAVVDVIKKGTESFGIDALHHDPGSSRDIHVLFSAHSLPRSFIEEGDPYVNHIKGSIDEITRKIDISWSLSYQSKSGPVKWLEPSTDDMIEELARKGVEKLLVVPISFVSDHIETLYEIDILYKNIAEAHKMTLKRTESLNTSPLFIRTLKDLVHKGLEDTGWLE